MSIFKKKDFEEVRLAGRTSGLERSLNALDLILLGLGAIVGTGVFALTGIVAANYAGPAVVLSYAIAGMTCIFVAFVYTELATMLPTSGSIYTYSYVAFGEIFAWLVGSIIIIELGFAAAAVAGSWAAYVQGVLTDAGIPLPDYLVKCPMEGGTFNILALIVVLLAGGMLYLGTKESKKLNNILVLIKMAAIFIFIFFAAPNFDATNWSAFIPYDMHKVLYGASFLFFAFTGFGTLASAAEECKNPKKDLTVGIIGSLVLSTVLYMIVAACLTGIAHYTTLGSAEALAGALRQNGSNIGSTLVATGAIAGMTTVILLNLFGLSRIFYAISRDGILPASLAKIHSKYDSPYVIIGIFTFAIAIMGGLLPCELLAKMSSMAALTDYIFVILIVMLFRITHGYRERPFKCPAIFIIAPIALIACIYLLFTQIVENGEIILTGRIYFCWFIIMFILYFVRSALMKTKAENL